MSDKERNGHIVTVTKNFFSIKHFFASRKTFYIKREKNNVYVLCKYSHFSRRQAKYFKGNNLNHFDTQLKKPLCQR